jgi:hypothetical protein
MKALFVTCLASLAALAAGCSTTTRQNTANNQRPIRLQLAVDVPPSMSIIHEDEVAEAFAYRVITSLHENGLRGRVHYLDGDDPNPDVPLLRLNLQEWRVNRVGMVDCAFIASLTNGGQTRDLGAFTGTSLMTWWRHDWWSRAEGYDESAHQAITDLARKLAEFGVLDRARDGSVAMRR